MPLPSYSAEKDYQTYSPHNLMLNNAETSANKMAQQTVDDAIEM